MGTCIICGADVDGAVCQSHQEDVVFEFEGDHPNQLTPNRYYRGTVDGFADFGVFVDIGDDVTGLLHRSELDKRLESLDWDEGDTVYVQVTDVRDNGNVDLGWSIRQSEGEFRGSLVDDPHADSPEEATQGNENAPAPTGAGATTAGGSTQTAVAASETSDSASKSEPEPEPEPERVDVDALDSYVGERVRIEGTVASIHQTGGPTIFELRDPTGVANCAAFEAAGVRAYPEVETDDAIRIDGEVERRHDELQVETESLERLDGDAADAVSDRLEEALTEAARPEDASLLTDHESVAAVEEEIRTAATAIRRAVFESRPIVVRHTATADGYVAGTAIERAVLPLVREEHAKDDAEYHYFDRRPLDDEVYGMDAATDDVTNMLDDRERHGEKLPLVLLVGAGSTVESREGFELLSLYDAKVAVVDAGHPDEAVVDSLAAAVNPGVADADLADVTSAALAANVAAHVNADVRDDLVHLPAVSYWEDAPDAYVALAEDAGYDADARRELREAIGLEAYYHSYEDKRELVTDLLFDGESGDGADRTDGLAAHVSQQFREKLDDEVETAEANIERREVGEVTVAVLDTEAFTHRFDFPPTGVLLDELHRRARADVDGTFVTLGAGEDELDVRSTAPLDRRTVAERASEAAPNAALRAVGGRDGRLTYLTGERDAVVDAVTDAVAAELA